MEKKNDMYENIEYLESINKNKLFSPIIETPFFKTDIIYADYTASGQIHKQIETYILKNVYPYYANTHSNAYNGKYMYKLITESKNLIRKSLNIDNNYAVVFTGNGCSSAVTHLIHALDLKNKKNINNKDKDTVIFITDYEHNSNFLPWRHIYNSDIEIVESDDTTGLILYSDLENKIKKYKDYKNKIISFSAGSNITGIIQDVSKISILGHKYNFKVIFDYAAIGPYVDINMVKNIDTGDYIDAIFISTHKFLGGVSTPGLLIAKKDLFINKCPYQPSGGTVRYTSETINLYSENIEVKESGGTPNIIGCIKAGLAFELKNNLINYIKDKDASIVKYALNRFKKMENVHILINNIDGKINQIPIFSFLISYDKNVFNNDKLFYNNKMLAKKLILGQCVQSNNSTYNNLEDKKGDEKTVANSNNKQFLHYNLIVVLLNDLFGIQSRGGVSCSGLYAKKILNIAKKSEIDIIKTIINDDGIPSDYGWCRVTLHYTMEWYIIEYILDAISIISKYGYLFLILYTYDKNLNLWNYYEDKSLNINLSLYTENKNEYKLNYSREDYKSKIFSVYEIIKSIKKKIN